VTKYNVMKTYILSIVSSQLSSSWTPMDMLLLPWPSHHWWPESEQAILNQTNI